MTSFLPITVTVKKVVTTGTAPTAREGHSLFGGPDKLYLFGGGVSDLQGPQQYNQLFELNVETNVWTRLDAAQAPSPRTGAAGACVNGKIVIFGGLDTEKGWVRGIHVFDLSTSTWSMPESALSGAPSGRDKLTPAVVDNRFIYYFGGFGPQRPGTVIEEEEEEEEHEDYGPAVTFSWFNDLYVLDTQDFTWKDTPTSGQIPTPRAAFGTAVVERKMYIIGGRDTSSRVNDVYSLDLDSNVWTKLDIGGFPPTARSFHSCSAVPATQKVVLNGGMNVGNKHLNDFFVLDLEVNTWNQALLDGDVPSPRGFHGGAIVGSNYYIFGGSSEFDTAISECRTYHNELFAFDLTPLQNVSHSP